MASKRNIVDEVISRRERHLKRVPRLAQSDRRLVTLFEAHSSLIAHTEIPLPLRKELYRHVPVALIAITEGYCRMLYSNIIDSGEPFLSRVQELKNIRLDIGDLIATNQSKISIGELISHQLPHNRLSDIEDNLSMLLGEDFGFEFTKRLEREDASIGGKIFQTHLRHFIIDAFRLRHILCHELAPKVALNQYKMEVLIKVFRVFLHMLDEHVSESTKGA
jgi:hypothetical protein